MNHLPFSEDDIKETMLRELGFHNPEFNHVEQPKVITEKDKQRIHKAEQKRLRRADKLKKGFK